MGDDRLDTCSILEDLMFIGKRIEKSQDPTKWIMLEVVGEIKKMAESSLHRASLYGHLDVVKHLMSIGVCDNDPFGQLSRFTLHGAICNGHTEIVRYLCSLGLETNPDDLISAASNGHLETVKYLVSTGIVEDNWAIKRAVSYGHFDVVRYLISIGNNYSECGLEEVFGIQCLPESRDQVLSVIDMFLVNKE